MHKIKYFLALLLNIHICLWGSFKESVRHYQFPLQGTSNSLASKCESAGGFWGPSRDFQVTSHGHYIESPVNTENKCILVCFTGAGIKEKAYEHQDRRYPRKKTIGDPNKLSLIDIASGEKIAFEAPEELKRYDYFVSSIFLLNNKTCLVALHDKIFHYQQQPKTNDGFYNLELINTINLSKNHTNLLVIDQIDEQCVTISPQGTISLWTISGGLLNSSAKAEIQIPGTVCSARIDKKEKLCFLGFDDGKLAVCDLVSKNYRIIDIFSAKPITHIDSCDGQLFIGYSGKLHDHGACCNGYYDCCCYQNAYNQYLSKKPQGCCRQCAGKKIEEIKENIAQTGIAIETWNEYLAGLSTLKKSYKKLNRVLWDAIEKLRKIKEDLERTIFTEDNQASIKEKIAVLQAHSQILEEEREKNWERIKDYREIKKKYYHYSSKNLTEHCLRSLDLPNEHHDINTNTPFLCCKKYALERAKACRECLKIRKNTPFQMPEFTLSHVGLSIHEYQKKKEELQAEEERKHKRIIADKSLCECRKKEILQDPTIPDICIYESYKKDSRVMTIKELRLLFPQENSSDLKLSQQHGALWKPSICCQELLFLPHEAGMLVAKKVGLLHGCLNNNFYLKAEQQHTFYEKEASIVKHTKDGTFTERFDLGSEYWWIRQRSLKPIEAPNGERIGWYLLSYTTNDKGYDFFNTIENLPRHLSFEMKGLTDQGKKGISSWQAYKLLCLKFGLASLGFSLLYLLINNSGLNGE